MTKLEYLFLIYMYDNGRTIYLIMGGLGEWRSSAAGTSEEPQGPPNSRYVVAINENRPDGRPRHQDKGFTPPPLVSRVVSQHKDGRALDGADQEKIGCDGANTKNEGRREYKRRGAGRGLKQIAEQLRTLRRRAARCLSLSGLRGHR